MIAAILFVVLLVCPAGAQEIPRPPAGSTDAVGAPEPSVGPDGARQAEGGGDGSPARLPSEPRRSSMPNPAPYLSAEARAPVEPADHRRDGPLGIEYARRFDWQSAALNSLRFLMLEHGARIVFQDKTRDKLGGPLLKDYYKTIRTRPRSFGDGDRFFTNWIAHPIQGATAYHLARISRASRPQSFWWGVAYSTQFELGILSEAMIGNVGISPVDLVVTPTLGYALGRTEEWLVERMRGSRRPWLRRMAPVLVPGRFLTALATGR